MNTRAIKFCLVFIVLLFSFSSCDNNGGSDPAVENGEILDLVISTLKKLTVEIDQEDIEMLQESGLSLNISIKVNGNFNVVWFSNANYLLNNEYEWSPNFEVYGSNVFETGAAVEIETNTLNVELGQEVILNPLGVLENSMESAPSDSISFVNNFGPIYPGMSQQIIPPDGMESILPSFVSPDLNNLETELLTSMNEVMLWFGEMETGTIFSKVPINSFVVDLTDIEEATALYSNGEWSIKGM